MLHLASKSPRRRELLRMLGLDFGILDLDIPEHPAAGEPPEDYVRRAVAYGRDRSALAPFRARLLAGRGTALLFDTPRLVRSLEGLFRAIWAEFAAGRLPQPDLTNLDTCLELGAAMDHDAEETGFRPDYEARWQAALARRHAYAPLPPDRRLWPAAG
jgi:hypothetical protein